jgi:hypothetical protein
MNEYEVIVFQDYQINLLEDDLDDSSDEDILEIIECNMIIEEQDIFTCEHPWDNIPNLRYRFKPEFWNYSDYEQSFFKI